MAFTTKKSKLNTGTETNHHWKTLYSPSDTVPVSGIYYCTNCNREVTCNKDDPFPPQNHAQHPCDDEIKWQLNVMTDTSAWK